MRFGLSAVKNRHRVTLTCDRVLATDGEIVVVPSQQFDSNFSRNATSLADGLLESTSSGRRGTGLARKSLIFRACFCLLSPHAMLLAVDSSGTFLPMVSRTACRVPLHFLYCSPRAEG